MKKNLLAIGAHADDIELSMGGAILKYMDIHHYTLTYVMSTNNMSGQFLCMDDKGRVASRAISPEEESKIRKYEAAEAAEKMFGTTPIHLDFPQRHYTAENGVQFDLRYGGPCPDVVPGRTLPSILTAHEDQEAIERMTEIILEHNPEVIITTGLADPNIEHICTGLLVRKARTKAEAAGYDGTLIYSMGPAPAGLASHYDRYDTFIDTTGHMEKKIEAVRFHASQKPCPESLDYRDWAEGARCGCGTAEPYILGAFGKYRTGAFTVELLKNHLYCRENYRRMFF